MTRAPRSSPLRGERGAALVLALLLLALGLAVLAAATVRASLAAQGAVRAESRARALNAAESGFAEAVERIRRDPWSGDFRGEIGGARYEVIVLHGTEPTAWRSATVTCTGRSGDQSRTFVATLSVLSDPTRPPPTDVRLAQWRQVSGVPTVE